MRDIFFTTGSFIILIQFKIIQKQNYLFSSSFFSNYRYKIIDFE